MTNRSVATAACQRQYDETLEKLRRRKKAKSKEILVY